MSTEVEFVIDLKTGVLNAGTDPRTEAYAWAW